MLECWVAETYASRLTRCDRMHLMVCLFLQWPKGPTPITPTLHHSSILWDATDPILIAALEQLKKQDMTNMLVTIGEERVRLRHTLQAR